MGTPMPSFWMIPTKIARGSTALSTAAVITRVFMTSAGVVPTDASAPASAPRAIVSQGASSRPWPPNELPVPKAHRFVYVWRLQTYHLLL